MIAGRAYFDPVGLSPFVDGDEGDRLQRRGDRWSAADRKAVMQADSFSIDVVPLSPDDVFMTDKWPCALQSQLDTLLELTQTNSCLSTSHACGITDAFVSRV
uniref:Uncharacterized protein n=1 Tax=Plectus sambesii TaxID=2011161 RepID=A0A914VYM0_9BILA